MKPSHFLALLLVACAVGLGLTGVIISQGDSPATSILSAGLFYTGACIAFAAALATIFVSVNKGD